MENNRIEFKKDIMIIVDISKDCNHKGYVQMETYGDSDSNSTHFVSLILKSYIDDFINNEIDGKGNLIKALNNTKQFNEIVDIHFNCFTENIILLKVTTLLLDNFKSYLEMKISTNICEISNVKTDLHKISSLLFRNIIQYKDSNQLESIKEDLQLICYKYQDDIILLGKIKDLFNNLKF